jgi:hypothetical protein
MSLPRPRRSHVGPRRGRQGDPGVLGLAGALAQVLIGSISLIILVYVAVRAAGHFPAVFWWVVPTVVVIAVIGTALDRRAKRLRYEDEHERWRLHRSLHRAQRRAASPMPTTADRDQNVLVSDSSGHETSGGQHEPLD